MAPAFHLGSNTLGVSRHRRRGGKAPFCLHTERKTRGWPISRILSRGFPPLDDHSSAARVTAAVKLPTRASGLKRPCGGLCKAADLSARGPYSALLRVGLAVPSRLPGPRWALTPPFHHHLARKADSSLWRFPWGRPRRALPGTLASWSPDFPRACARGHPAIRAWGSLRPPRGAVKQSRRPESALPDRRPWRHPPHRPAPPPRAGTAGGTPAG